MEYLAAYIAGFSILTVSTIYIFGIAEVRARGWNSQELIDRVYKNFNPAINLTPLSSEDSDVFTYTGKVDVIRFFKKDSYEQAHDELARRVYSGFFTFLARRLVPTLSIVYVKSVNVVFPTPFKKGSVITVQISYSLRAPRGTLHYNITDTSSWTSESIADEIRNLNEQISNKEQVEGIQEVSEEVIVKKVRSIVILKRRK